MRNRLALCLAAVLAVLLAGAGLHPTQAAPTWAPVEDATIRPGVQTFTDGGQCTANFVFRSASGDVFLGQSAHCAGTGAATETDGCDAGSLPLGTRVDVEGASRPGTLVYSSWLTMQKVGERDDWTCQYNDFALVRLHPADHGRVNPTVPFWGGPTGLQSWDSKAARVFSYGNSGLRLGLDALSPKEGRRIRHDGGGWNHAVYTVTPGVPGDSGSGFMDWQGHAFGVLSTLAIAPLAGSNGVTDLDRALDYAARHAGVRVDLVPGTEPFRRLY